VNSLIACVAFENFLAYRHHSEVSYFVCAEVIKKQENGLSYSLSLFGRFVLYKLLLQII
jgi:hypothetical protein